MIPGLYNGRNRTYYFGQYQGFRQILGTTQMLPVPTPEERRGLNSTAFPGDILHVPVGPRIAPVLARYPLPNDAQGPYGARTYATSSKVQTVTDQFSVRVDHKISDKAQFFTRFNLNDMEGPLDESTQTALDPSFAIRFFDHQRNFGMSYIRTQSPTFLMESYLGYVRSTPNFPTVNSTQPALVFGDGLYEGFNSAAVLRLATGTCSRDGRTLPGLGEAHLEGGGGNTHQPGYHCVRNGAQLDLPVRRRGRLFAGRDSIAERTSRHRTGRCAARFAHRAFDRHALFVYRHRGAAAIRPGKRMGVAAVRRQAYNFFVQDRWTATPRLAVSYGLRYEINSTITEGQGQAAGFITENASGERIDPMNQGARALYLVRPQPHYPLDWGGWGPRLAIDWKLDDKTVFRAGASITSQLMNLWQQNSVTANLPFTVTPYATAAPGRPPPFRNAVTPVALPDAYTTSGQPIFATGRSSDVAPNTEMDVPRFQRDLAALSPDKQVHALAVQGMSPDVRNGYIGAWTAAMERTFGEITASAAYVATAGIRLGCLESPNGYAGAEPGFAPYTSFDAQGRAQGGFGPIWIVGSQSHSTYHSLQVSAGKTSLRGGLGFQVSYTFSKSIDDTSAVLGGFLGGPPGTNCRLRRRIHGTGRRERTFDLRRDPRLHAERDPGTAR